MSILDDQITINERLLKAVKDLIGSMEEAHKCMNLLAQRIRNLEARLDTRGGNGNETRN